jgi:hypothetical protein
MNSCNCSGKLTQNHYLCDRIISEIRELSPKIISGDSLRSEITQTHHIKHTISMKFK